MDERLIETIVDQVTQRLLADRSSSSIQTGSMPSGASVTDDIKAGRVVVNISARHIHLTNEHVEALFGGGAKLKPMKPLIQTGEFASEQQVLLVGPTGKTLGPVRVLGPTRKASQVEISLTDCYALGLKTLPPIRPSGDHTGTFGITMVGPAGAVTLTSGLIRANRHIHLHTSQGAAMGLKNNDPVDVRIEGERPAIFLGCQARVHDMFLAEMHIDTDDGNAVGIKSGALAQILLPNRR
ncbi:MAG: phosphate propanoyltransferase [Candidatus Sumerlaeaceae bacterium]